MKLFFISLLFSVPLYASELCTHDLHPELKELFELEKAINWTAASDSQIRNAPCTRKAPFTEDEMKSWMSRNDSSPRISKTINGISFEDESFENLESFKHLTTYVDILGDLDPNKHRNFTSTCKKVACAVKEIFGNDTGLQLLYMQRRFGMNGSHIIKESTRATPWRKSELDTVLLALSDFPDGIMPVQDTRTMIHAPRNQGNGSTIANAIITVYELWNEQSPEQQRSTIVHELGHVLAFASDVHDHDQWTSQSGWTETSKVVDGETVTVYESSNNDAIISEYGLTNPREDFAESVVAYRYNPQALKEASPGKYNLIKESIFDNVEYTSEEACSNPDRMSQQYISELTQEISSWQPSPLELRDIANRCSSLVINTLAENSEVKLTTSELQNCYNRSVASQTSELVKEKIKDLPNKEFLVPLLRNSRINVPPALVSSIAQAARNTHLENLRGQLTNVLNDDYFCKPDFIQYAAQKFDKELLGLDTYGHREQLIKIAENACQAREASSARTVAETLIK